VTNCLDEKRQEIRSPMAQLKPLGEEFQRLLEAPVGQRHDRCRAADSDRDRHCVNNLAPGGSRRLYPERRDWPR
jgi:hypothetical protein